MHYAKVLITDKVKNIFNNKEILEYIQIHCKIDLQDTSIFIEGSKAPFIKSTIDYIDRDSSIANPTLEEFRAVFLSLKNKKQQSKHTEKIQSNQVQHRSPNQAVYKRLIEEKNIIFAAGPAGTGKTHIAVGMAINALESHKTSKVILSRPVVDAGECLGALPGDVSDKVAPYMKPLYDEITHWIPKQKLQKYCDDEIIEISPLAYMRGRTFKNAWVIVDEAQNMSSIQMKMLLTRIGVGSKIIIAGDYSQTDIRGESGFKDAINRLSSIDEIGIAYLTRDDIVRDRIISKILDAYDR